MTKSTFAMSPAKALLITEIVCRGVRLNFPQQWIERSILERFQDNSKMEKARLLEAVNSEYERLKGMFVNDRALSPEDNALRRVAGGESIYLVYKETGVLVDFGERSVSAMYRSWNRGDELPLSNNLLSDNGRGADDGEEENGRLRRRG